MSNRNWSLGESEGPVQLPDGRHLYLRAAGPARASPSRTPAIVLIHGLGGTYREWLTVQRLLAAFARVYLYERAGYHGNLRALLRVAGVAPPYLLVGHSYGGVLARQFLHDFEGEVGGLVLVDSVPVVNRFPAVWTRLLRDAPYEQVVGLEDNLNNLGIDRSEYEADMRESALNEAPGGIAERELALMVPHNQRLRDSLHSRPNLLGDRPLEVVFCDESGDFGKVYEYGVRHGLGTAEEREVVRKHLETMSRDDEAAQREQLGLSRNARVCEDRGGEGDA